MSRKTYFVRAVWDLEAHTYYSESNIHGLHIEAPTLDEFEELVFDLGPMMIAENHDFLAELASNPSLDLVPTIIFEKPMPALSQ